MVVPALVAAAAQRNSAGPMGNFEHNDGCRH